jgi:hypothetical protein
VTVEQEEKGKRKRKGGGDMATDERGPWVSDSGARPNWWAAWRCAGWTAPRPKAAAGRLGRLAAQEGKQRVSLLSLFLLNI